MNSKQFAWLYLVQNGKAGIGRAYYGGYDTIDENWENMFGSYWSIESHNKAYKYYATQMKSIGVDWDKTEAPKSDSISTFNGTFADSTKAEILTGVLVLKDGTEQHWEADAIEITNVFDMMAAVSEATEKFNTLFGESNA